MSSWCHGLRASGVYKSKPRLTLSTFRVYVRWLAHTRRRTRSTISPATYPMFSHDVNIPSEHRPCHAKDNDCREDHGALPCRFRDLPYCCSGPRSLSQFRSRSFLSLSQRKTASTRSLLTLPRYCCAVQECLESEKTAKTAL